MAQQPPGGWEQFATKRDLADLEVKTQAGFVELNAKMDVPVRATPRTARRAVRGGRYPIRGGRYPVCGTVGQTQQRCLGVRCGNCRDDCLHLRLGLLGRLAIRTSDYKRGKTDGR